QICDRLCENVEDVRLAHGQAGIVARRNRQRDDALIDVFEIDPRRLFLFRRRFGSGGGSLSGGLLLFRLFSRFFFFRPVSPSPCAPVAPSFFSEGFSSVTFSSSLSGASGDETSLRRTTA